MEFDIHLHTIASGHGTSATIADMARAAARRNLKMIGISDHGPATAGAAASSYFRSLALAPRQRLNIDILYGVELNILDHQGRVDLADEVLMNLDYAIISMHAQNYQSGTVTENTQAYINAMCRPKVKVIGHCDDHAYPVDYERLLVAAMEHRVFFEINNSSLSPEGYRGDTTANNRRILELCRKYNYPVLLASDSHGPEHLGDYRYAQQLLTDVSFPPHLILNHSVEHLKANCPN